MASKSGRAHRPACNSRTPPPAFPIDRLSIRDDADEIAAYFAAGAPRPVIFTDAAAEWPAKQKWTFAFFASRYGSQPGVVPVRFGMQPIVGKVTLLGAFIGNLDAGFEALPGLWVGTEGQHPPPATKAGWSFLWEGFGNDPELVADVSPFPSAVPNLTADLPRDLYCALEAIHGRVLTTVYISRLNTVTRLHRDWGHTFGCLTQFQGRKTVYLMPPGEYEAVGGEDFDPEHPDYGAYPPMRDRPVYASVIAPAEMLLIPPDWLHYTRSQDHSITLSQNFFNQVNFGDHLRFLLGEIVNRCGDLGLFDLLAGLLG